MPSDGLQTPLPGNVFARLTAATRYAITGATPASWFGPQRPLAPQAPPEVKGRQWDYPFGVNLNYVPRSESAISFGQLRALADALPLLRAVIETRKDQIAGLGYSVRARNPSAAHDAAQRIAATLAFLARPDRRHGFNAWLRMWLEDMLVIDAACLYPRFTRGGDLHSLDVIDGATIAPLIGEDGRAPEPPDPAFQQALHGVPAADFTADELLYLPRNVRSHRLYGLSPVEQIALTVNIALRRDQATLDYYNAGSVPDSFATLPKDWTVDQIRQFQDYFDALMSGNSARRRMVKFMPAEFQLTETRQPPLKDQYDEWLARIICYAFSVPASAFVSQVNRATSETLRMQATQEGLVPLKTWIKSALDHVVQVCLKQPDLEFVWVGDDAIDPLRQAQTLNILVSAGIKTREEARAELGLGPEGKRDGVAKYNDNHDERGRFATAGNAVVPGARSSPGKPAKPQGVRFASNHSGTSRTRTDASPAADGAPRATGDETRTPRSRENQVAQNISTTPGIKPFVIPEPPAAAIPALAVAALDAWRSHGENERTAQAGVTLGLNPADPNAVLAARACVWSEYNIQQLSSSVPFSGPDLTAVQEAVALNEFAHPGTAGRADQSDPEAIKQLQALAAATLESRRYQPANAAPAGVSTMSFARVQYECPEACGVPGTPFLGGGYGCIKGGDTEGHHTPMNSASYLPLFLGPAIQMDPADHRLLPSSKNQGDFLAAAQLTVLYLDSFGAAAKLGDAEVELYFPDKYTGAFRQRDAYIKCLVRKNIIKE